MIIKPEDYEKYIGSVVRVNCPNHPVCDNSVGVLGKDSSGAFVTKELKELSKSYGLGVYKFIVKLSRAEKEAKHVTSQEPTTLELIFKKEDLDDEEKLEYMMIIHSL